MKKFLIAVVASLAFCTTHAAADTGGGISVKAVADAGFSNLSAEQQAEVLKQVTTMQQKAPTGRPAATVDTVDKWVNIGERIGKMMGGAAKEVGVAVNEFVKTDVGRWTMMLVIWNYIGNDLVHIFIHIGGAIIVWVIGFSVIFNLVRRRNPLVITRDVTKRNVFGNYPVLKTERNKISDDDMAMTLISGLIILVAGILMLTTT